MQEDHTTKKRKNCDNSNEKEKGKNNFSKNEKKPKFESESYININELCEDSEENYEGIDNSSIYNIAFNILIEQYKSNNISPYLLLKKLGIQNDYMNEETGWHIIDEISKCTNPWEVIKYLHSDDIIPKTRIRMNDLDDSMEEAIRLIKKSKRIIILTGAGVSVSCGIPDFRSAGGVYDQIESKYGLSDPQLLFDINHLFQNPKPFFEFAKEIYPGNYTPSLAHQFIARLENEGKLLRNYTQNIDTLEDSAGIKRVVHCHGNFSYATCITCNKRVQAFEIKDKIMNSEIPFCDLCDDKKSFFKPNIVFFGEDLPNKFYNKIKQDENRADLLIIMGSSLRVNPVATIPNKFKDIPQILINREMVSPSHEFDVNLLGEADEIVREISRNLGWDLVINHPPTCIDELSGDFEDEKIESFNFLPDSSMPLFNLDSYDSNSNSNCSENIDNFD